jgi:hypothetical protein
VEQKMGVISKDRLQMMVDSHVESANEAAQK